MLETDAGRRGKTVQVRRGDAAVIGQTPEHTLATAMSGKAVPGSP